METNGLEHRRVCLGMPGYDSITAGAAQGFYMASAGRTRIDGRAVALDVDRRHAEGSLLANSFNRLWAWALNENHRGPAVDYFAMLHADIEPQIWWLDKAIAEMERGDYDVLSVVVPIKDPNALTSTALERPDGNPWAPLCRITMKEVYDLPETFDESHTGYPLLLNTGCWVCRFDKLKDLGLAFTINDRIIFNQAADEFVAEVESEDWNFSRQCHAAGLRLGATRKIGLNHAGKALFTNQTVWGEQHFDQSLVNASVLPKDDGAWKFPHDVEGWLSYREGKALADLARGKRVLEIGSYCGRSTICMAQTAESVVAIDPFDGSGTPRPRSTADEFRDNIARYGVADRVEAIHPDGAIPRPKFDLAFIDGAHDSDSVQADIDKSLACLKPDGLLVFHDYRSEPGECDGRWDPGVNEAVDRLVIDGGEILARHETIAVVRPPAYMREEALA